MFHPELTLPLREKKGNSLLIVRVLQIDLSSSRSPRKVDKVDEVDEVDEVGEVNEEDEVNEVTK